MTDNERRAHDLAIAVAVEIGRLKANAQTLNGEKIDINYLSEYISAYKLALDAFEKEFPTEQVLRPQP